MTDPPTDLPTDLSVRRLTVRGHGRATLPPDEAEVTLGVEVVRPTAGEARDTSAQAMTAVLEALRGIGVADAHLRTTGLTLAPEIEYRPDGTSRRIGFRLTDRVTVRVPDPATVPSIVDAGIGAGATSLDGLVFRARANAAARRAALTAAVADARDGAEALAGAAGARLGAVRTIWEADGLGGPVPSPNMAMLEARAADTPVLPGTTAIEAFVEITWDIEPHVRRPPV